MSPTAVRPPDIIKPARNRPSVFPQAFAVKWTLLQLIDLTLFLLECRAHSRERSIKLPVEVFRMIVHPLLTHSVDLQTFVSIRTTIFFCRGAAIRTGVEPLLRQRIQH